MLYDELTRSNDYICHHGVKGQKWGVRRFANSHLFRKNREAYRAKITQERQKSKDKQMSFVNERNDIIKSHVKSTVKSAAVSAGIGTLTGLGAAFVGGLVGGPTGMMTVGAIANAGTIALGTAGAAQSIAMWANTISRGLALSEVYKK